MKNSCCPWRPQGDSITGVLFLNDDDDDSDSDMMRQENALFPEVYYEVCLGSIHQSIDFKGIFATEMHRDTSHLKFNGNLTN